LIEQRAEALQLEVLTGDAGLDRAIPTAEVSNPGLVLAGYTARFAADRVYVLGETEISYLFSLEPAERRARIDLVCGLGCPCLFVTKGLEVPPELVELGQTHGVAVIRSRLKTSEFYNRLKPFLEEVFAPQTAIHGSLADVYGVGLLLVGRSGIGKSECVLDLVERGHRVVADDVVLVRRLGHDVLIGRGHEHQHHFMEIRGIGLIDIAALFGIRAVRQQKRIEVVVQLEDWDSAAPYDRTGLDGDDTTILDVTIPRVVVPLNPGKNITVIAEIVAMRHLLKYSGVDSAREFNEGLIGRMQERRVIREYLEEDYE
jgi:HPr kinase/phosphorylase